MLELTGDTRREGNSKTSAQTMKDRRSEAHSPRCNLFFGHAHYVARRPHQHCLRGSTPVKRSPDVDDSANVPEFRSRLDMSGSIFC